MNGEPLAAIADGPALTLLELPAGRPQRGTDMAAKNDIQHGINAEVTADRDAVVAACRRAADPLGKHAKLEANAASVTVSILPGLSEKLSRVSPVVGITLRPADGGRVQLDTRVQRHRTIQSKVFGFIPAGPKRLVGRQYFFKFLNALETELGALDPAAGSVVRRTAQRT